MIELELTCEQRIKMAALINGIAEIPIRMTIDCGKDYTKTLNGALVQQKAILRITTIPVLINIELSDEQLTGIMAQVFDSLDYRMKKIKEITESLTTTDPEE